MLSKEQSYALLLSTLAGLSTSIGGAAAIIQRPGDGQLALLLGLAIGVMATLSVVELWIKNALEHGAWGISAAVFGGALLYYLVQPYLPDFEQHHTSEAASEKQPARKEQTLTRHLEDGSPRAALEGHQVSQAIHRRAGEGLRSRGGDAGQKGQAGSILLSQETASSKDDISAASAEAALSLPTSKVAAARSAELLRLGLLMALTMTLHNMPEGFAVAFASFTDFGPLMAVAIAVHNIPEGVIVAAPVYAATGSRWKALGISVASGLSEPVGALIALLVVRPTESSTMLNQYMLAFVGGIMTGVCYLELWPEAKKCHEDRRLWQGIALGSIVMGSTLIIGV
ncbi:hypothetical protein WJX74_003411 [Apatococcus lobatus]|uniref:Uncharacterized protein n=2 Tax=Apatococcus TaxID=904362 RepID=A0AAW1QYP4_9CHLO